MVRGERINMERRIFLVFTVIGLTLYVQIKDNVGVLILWGLKGFISQFYL